MPDPLCRLSVQHGPHTVDLALPSETPVGLLMPSIVDLVHRGPVALNEGRQWHLSRVGEERLDAAGSLHDNAIRDGELLLLTTAGTPSPVWAEGDIWHAMTDVAHTSGTPTRVTTATASLCAAVLGAAALVWSGAVTHSIGHIVTAAALAVAAAIGAVAMRRANADPILCVTLSVIAVVFAAAAGFLAVPGSPTTANSLLAGATACATSTLLLRVTPCGAISLTSAATFTALTCAALACGVAWTLSVSTTGAVLSVLSLGTLGVAAKLSIATAGLAPAIASSNEPGDDDPALETPRAVAAHHTLTGLVVGSAGAAALGATLVVLGSAHDGRPWRNAAIFAAVVGLVMVLRARTHVDPRRRTALVVGGMTAIASAVARIVVSAPTHANWVALLVTATGLSMLGGFAGAAVNPLARRAIDIVEYLALAAVVPLACWVAGFYGLIRGLSLP
jgi:type VII secretion integral membrane protein EccD